MFLHHRKKLQVFGLGLLAVALILGILHFTSLVMENEAVAALVNQFGYLGVLITAFIAGLNAIVPVPAWSFVPIFIAAGLWIPLIIVALVIGTTLADLLAFYIGVKTKNIASDRYPKIQSFTTWLQNGKSHFVVPVIFLHASFSPFPNEILLVPLAFAGVRMRTLIIPLVLGTILYQTAFAYGSQGVVNWLLTL